MIEEHLKVSQSVASGLLAMPEGGQAFASTQAAWRFYKNEEITLKQLSEPIIRNGVKEVEQTQGVYALIAHDWSQIDYSKHTGKKDRMELGLKTSLGYKLETALMLSAVDGTPLAPLCQRLISAKGVYSSKSQEIEEEKSVLDDLSQTICFTEQLGIKKQLVHIIV